MIDLNSLPLEGQGGLMDLLKYQSSTAQTRGVRHPVVTIVAIASARRCRGGQLLCHRRMRLKHSATMPCESSSSRPHRLRSPPSVACCSAWMPTDWNVQIGRGWPLSTRWPAAAWRSTAKTVAVLTMAPQRSPPAQCHPASGSVCSGSRRGGKNQRKSPNCQNARPRYRCKAPLGPDALHTNKNTAPIWLNQQADYLFIVKDNQAACAKTSRA